VIFKEYLLQHCELW